MDLGTAAEGMMGAVRGGIILWSSVGHLLALGLATLGLLTRGRMRPRLAWLALGIVAIVDVGLLWIGAWIWIILEVWGAAAFLAATGMGAAILAFRALESRQTSDAGPDDWSPPDPAEVERVIAGRGR